MPLRRPANIFAGFPSMGVSTWLGDRSLLVVAPHPDDESLGMGGVIAATAALGNPLTVVFVTSGEGSHRGSPSYPAGRLAALRREEAAQAVAILAPGRDAARFLDLPDGGLPSFPHPDQAVEALARFMTPDTVTCVTSPTDPHGDHRQAFAWTREAARRTGAALWTYPVWTWMSDALVDVDMTGLRLDVARYLARKRDAISAHRSQHGLVVDDAEDAFVLPASMVDRLCQPFEVLIRHDD